MTHPHTASTDDSAPRAERGASLSRWLDRPISQLWCLVGWISSVVAFVGLIRLLGGPSDGDAAESVYSTWAIAHGTLACAWPQAEGIHVPRIARPGPFIPPLWPLVSGGIAAVARVGHGLAFPSSAALGANCATAERAMYAWGINAHALTPTLRIGYVAWLAVMVGAVALLRASGRGRTRWEPAMLLAVACTPAVFEPVLVYFHPQDLVTMGLVLGALACAVRSRWIAAGVLMGLAISAQQFALLAFAPLVFVAPRRARVGFVAGAGVALAAIDGSVLALTGGRAAQSELVGSGNTKSIGGSVLWELHLSGALLVGASRVAPIVLAGLLGWYAVRRLGDDARAPVVLVSLVAVCLGLRLVFEQQLFGYYYMPLSIAAVAIDALQRRFRAATLCWIGLVTLAFNPIPWALSPNAEPWGYVARADLPLAVFSLGVLLVGVAAWRHTARWYQLAWLVVVSATFLEWPIWKTMPLRVVPPSWLLQVVLVPLGIALVASPLVERLFASRSSSGAARSDAGAPDPGADDLLIAAPAPATEG